MAELIYKGMKYRDNATVRVDGVRAFVPTDEPLPVGSRLIVKQGHDEHEYVVTHVRERGETGMEMKRVDGGAPNIAIDDEPTMRPGGDEEVLKSLPKRKN
jgi:hypothetical protein